MVFRPPYVPIKSISQPYSHRPVQITPQIPTALSTPSPPRSGGPGKRTAIIAGTTIVGFLLLFGLLAGVFLYHRRKLKLKLNLQRLLRPMRSRREGRGLLDGEDFFDEDDEDVLAMRAYRDFNSRSVTPNSAVMARPTEQPLGNGRDFVGGFVDPFAREIWRSGEERGGEAMREPTRGGSMFAGPGHTLDRSSATMASSYSGAPLQPEITDTTSLLDDPSRRAGGSVP